jgi:hypothetical protein
MGRCRLTIKAEILEECNCTACELGTTCSSRGRLGKVGRVGPASNRKQYLQLAVTLLLEEQLLCAAIDVGANIVPRISGIVLVSIRPSIGQIHLSSLWSHVGESIEHVSKFFSRKILRVEVATINSLSSVSYAFGGVD